MFYNIGFRFIRHILYNGATKIYVFNWTRNYLHLQNLYVQYII
jgi:hypothetical protein